MKRSYPLLFALALVLAATAGADQERTATTPAAPLTVDAIVARNLAAKGGRDRLEAITSARATGRLELPNGTNAPFVWEWQAPNLVRMEFATQAGASVQAFDGEVAWQINQLHNSGRPERLAKEMSDLFALEADFVGPLLDHADKGHQVVLVAKQAIDADPTHHLRVTLKTGHVLDVRLDPGTFLESRQTMTVEANGAPLRIEVTLTDYREVDGILLPFVVRSHAVGGVSDQTMAFESITLGGKIDPARFTMPAEPPAAPAE